MIIIKYLDKMSSIVSTRDFITNDPYLIIADIFLSIKKYDLYKIYVTRLIDISDSIISFEETLQENDVNGLFNTNNRLIKEKNQSLIEILENLSDDIILYINSNQIINLNQYSYDYSKFCEINNIVNNLKNIINNYDYDYYYYSNNEWILRKSKLEYYLEMNVIINVEDCCEKNFIQRQFSQFLEYFTPFKNKSNDIKLIK